MASSPRPRRTKADLDAIDEAIIQAVSDNSPVTVRGVYYRVVSAGAIEKTEGDYLVISRELLKLRRSRRVRYADITDGTRWITKARTYGSVREALEDTARLYRHALWDNQDVTVQVFTEKDAISGVIQPVAEEWDVALGVIRGYSSESFAWKAAEAIRHAHEGGRSVHVYQLGDHDPSGVDAWRDFTAKVTEFASPGSAPLASADYSGPGLRPRGPRRWAGQKQVPWLHFERLAVTEDQITGWSLPTRPTKDGTVPWTGGGSVEVDAIPAPQLRQLLRDAITSHLDQAALTVTRAAEESERDILTRIGNRDWGQEGQAADGE